jgi:hypothetical protein
MLDLPSLRAAETTALGMLGRGPIAQSGVTLAHPSRFLQTPLMAEAVWSGLEGADMSEVQGWIVIGLLVAILFSQWRIAQWGHGVRVILGEANAR